MADILTSPTLSSANVIYCPNGTQWILSVLDQCAVTPRDHASVYVGFLSILCYAISTFPQFREAYKSGKMHQAMSRWFLLLWTLVDLTNAAGVFLADQLPLQKFLSIYFLLIDSLLIFVYFYFKCLDQRPTSYTTAQALCGFALLGSGATFSLFQESQPTLLNPGHVIPGRHLLSANGDEEYSIEMKIGFIVGFLSTAFIIMFRIPQIITNFCRKSVEGLALGMFLLFLVGNICLGLSICIKSPDEGQTEASKLLHHLPWLIGCLSSFFSDCIIMYQFFRYWPRAGSDEKLPLQHFMGSLCS